jgi:hypothetical protein
MVAWKYIDKQAITVSAIRDFDSMNAIIDTTPQSVKDKYDMITNPVEALSKSSVTKITCEHNATVKKKIGDIDFVKARYVNALEYMEWFMPAWTNLTQLDQKILKEYYMSGSRRSGASARLQNELNYSDRQIDRLRASALETLSLLLLGE